MFNSHLRLFPVMLLLHERLFHTRTEARFVVCDFLQVFTAKKKLIVYVISCTDTLHY